MNGFWQAGVAFYERARSTQRRVKTAEVRVARAARVPQRAVAGVAGAPSEAADYLTGRRTRAPRWLRWTAIFLLVVYVPWTVVQRIPDTKVFPGIPGSPTWGQAWGFLNPDVPHFDNPIDPGDVWRFLNPEVPPPPDWMPTQEDVTRYLREFLAPGFDFAAYCAPTTATPPPGGIVQASAVTAAADEQSWWLTIATETGAALKEDFLDPQNAAEYGRWMYRVVRVFVDAASTGFLGGEQSADVAMWKMQHSAVQQLTTGSCGCVTTPAPTQPGGIAPLPAVAPAQPIVPISQTAPGEAPQVTWAAPALDNPTTLDVPASGGTISLPSGRDVVLRMPAAPVQRGITLQGAARNVVLVGGEVRDDGSANDHSRAIHLKDVTGTIHVEGVRFTGKGTEDVITMQLPGSTTVQLQNLYVESIAGTVAGNHGDFVQTWAGPRVLRMAGLHAEDISYQGFFIAPEQHGSPIQQIEARDIYLNGAGGSGVLLWNMRDYPITASNIWIEPDGTGESTKGNWPGVQHGRAQVLSGTPGIGYVAGAGGAPAPAAPAPGAPAPSVPAPAVECPVVPLGPAGPVAPMGDCPATTSPTERGLKPRALHTFRCAMAAHPWVVSTGGVGKRGNKSYHPTGEAVDFMIPGWDTAAGDAYGDALADWLWAHREELGVTEVIWQGRIATASRASEGWRPYTHPSKASTPTLDHDDHVHASAPQPGATA